MAMADDILERTLITGAGGALAGYADFGVKKDHSSLDITDLKSVRRVFVEAQPRAVLHLAAATDMAKCEADPAYAYMVNSVGTYNLALVAREVGAHFVYVSTAGVFDGNEQGAYAEGDVPNPPNMYGHSKYLGELAVSGLLENYLIVRTCWVFGGGAENDKKFVGKIVAQLRNPEVKALRGTNDEIGMPTYGKDLMTSLKKLLSGNEKGVVHIANEGTASRYEVAKYIAGIIAPAVPVEGVPLSSFNLSMEITKNQSLSSRIGLMRPWQEALKEYLTNEW